MKRKKIWPLFIAALLSIGLLLASCKGDTVTADLLGDYVRKSDFEGVTRSGAVSFTIGTRVFLATGYDGTNRLKDLWEFDAAKNTWFRRADFPGVARSAAVAFSAAGKGYVGTGYDGTNRLNDFWEYNPATDKWVQIADFPALDSKYRFGAVSLSFSNKGYIGSGYGGTTSISGGNDLKDWWSYTPATGAWTQVQSIGGSKRTNAFSFIVNGKGYVGGGSNNGSYPIDFWQFDPTNEQWTQKNGLDDIAGDPNFTYALQREFAVAFSVNNLGYLVTGTYTQALKNCWEYDPNADSWTQKTDFEGTARDGAIGFAVGTKGYITTGKSGTFRFDDLWEFDPTLAYVE